jgi:hypothetical protein
MEILLRLTPRIPQTDVTSVQIHLGLTDYGTLIVENVALDLKGGGKLTTRFRNLFGKAAVDFDPYRLENPKPMASEWSKVKDVKVKDLPCQGQAW